MSNLIDAITTGAPLPRPPSTTAGLPPTDPANVLRVPASVFREDTTPPLSMHDITEALAAKRAENRVKLKRLAELHQEMADILNSFDA